MNAKDKVVAAAVEYVESLHEYWVAWVAFERSRALDSNVSKRLQATCSRALAEARSADAELALVEAVEALREESEQP